LRDITHVFGSNTRIMIGAILALFSRVEIPITKHSDIATYQDE